MCLYENSTRLRGMSPAEYTKSSITPLQHRHSFHISTSDMVEFPFIKVESLTHCATGVLWTIGGYSMAMTSSMAQYCFPDTPLRARDPLQVAILFDPNAKTPFSEALSGISILPSFDLENSYNTQSNMTDHKRWHQYSEAARNVQIFFSWSVHTVYSTRVACLSSQSPPDARIVSTDSRKNSAASLSNFVLDGTDGRYVGLVDYRVLLNWIVCAQSSDVSRWLIAA